MKCLNNYCRYYKCCVCTREGQCLSVNGDYFILADKNTINDRLTRLSGRYKVHEIAFMRWALDRMEQEEREEKECMENKEIKGLENNYAYKKGLEEAWKITRDLLIDNFDEQSLGHHSNLDAIFGKERPALYDILKHMSIHEVKEKIEAYEKEQAKPKLGDVVKINFLPDFDCEEVGIYIHENDTTVRFLRKTNRKILETVNMERKYITSIEKTGKHFDIQSMLDEIG